MKNNTEKNAFIFELWDKQGLSIPKIAEYEIPTFLSLKTIRNIIYAGAAGKYNVKNGINSIHGREIYRMYRNKFLQLQDVDASIRYVHQNQPTHRLSIKQIRKIINRELLNRSAKFILHIE